MFSNILRRWAEARGNVLLDEIRDSIRRLRNASPETTNELSRVLIHEYASLGERVGSLANVSDRFKKELAAEYRRAAQGDFDRNLGRAYGLAVIAIFLEAQATPGVSAELATVLAKEVIETAQATPQIHSDNFATEQRIILLELAKKIREADNSLDKMLFVTAGFSAAATDLSKKYGERAVEKNCPAIQILFGFTGDGNQERAKLLFDELVRDLDFFKDSESATWLRMAWMLTPKALESAMKETESS